MEEKDVADAKGNFRLIHFNDSFKKVAVGIDHRAPQLLRQKPSRLVGDAELVFQLTCRWNGSPSHAPPRTMLSAAISTAASQCRR